MSLTMKGLGFRFQGCCGVSVLGGLTQSWNGKVAIPLSIYTAEYCSFFFFPTKALSKISPLSAHGMSCCSVPQRRARPSIRCLQLSG